MSESQTPEEIEADIARQREDLAATVTELQQRLDVKAKAQAKVTELKGRPEVLAGVGVTAAALVALIVWRVRRGGDD